MAALDSLDSLTDADREHLAPFLHAGPTTARSTALQYVKSDPVSKKEPQGRRILVAAVCAKNPDGGSARELPPCRDPARTHGNTLLGCLLASRMGGEGSGVGRLVSFRASWRGTNHPFRLMTLLPPPPCEWGYGAEV